MTDGYWTDGPLADLVPYLRPIPTQEQREADDQQCALLDALILNEEEPWHSSPITGD